MTDPLGLAANGAAPGPAWLELLPRCKKSSVLKDLRRSMIRKATDHFAETPLDDELVLMNIDTGSFHALKGTGLAIWQLIDGTSDEAAICAALLQTYAVDPQTCQAEVSRFIEQMVGAGFVERA
jgi:PqqD family protein of HPr-rel-A system